MNEWTFLMIFLDFPLAKKWCHRKGSLQPCPFLCEELGHLFTLVDSLDIGKSALKTTSVLSSPGAVCSLGKGLPWHTSCWLRNLQTPHCPAQVGERPARWQEACGGVTQLAAVIDSPVFTHLSAVGLLLSPHPLPACSVGGRRSPSQGHPPALLPRPSPFPQSLLLSAAPAQTPRKDSESWPHTCLHWGVSLRVPTRTLKSLSLYNKDKP